MAKNIIEVNVNDVVYALEQTGKSVKSIAKQSLGIIARGAVKVIKADIRAKIEKHSGDLLRAYGYKVHKDGTQANIYPKNRTDNIYPKTIILSYGHTGGTVRAPSWIVEARDFVQTGKTWVADTSNYSSEIDRMVDRTLDKYWSK